MDVHLKKSYDLSLDIFFHYIEFSVTQTVYMYFSFGRRNSKAWLSNRTGSYVFAERNVGDH